LEIGRCTSTDRPNDTRLAETGKANAAAPRTSRRRPLTYYSALGAADGFADVDTADCMVEIIAPNSSSSKSTAVVRFPWPRSRLAAQRADLGSVVAKGVGPDSRYAAMEVEL
jgi:hypothetical protein